MSDVYKVPAPTAKTNLTFALEREKLLRDVVYQCGDLGVTTSNSAVVYHALGEFTTAELVALILKKAAAK